MSEDSHIGSGRSGMDALDAAVDALPPAERRGLEYAALLPADMVPRSWLVSLVSQDTTLALAGRPGVGADPAEAVVDTLIGLGLLRPVPGEGALLALQSAHRGRLVERMAADEARRGPLLDAVEKLGVARGQFLLEGWVEEGAQWELTPLVGLAGALHAAGRLPAAVLVANKVSGPLQELGRLDEARAVLERVLADEARLVAETNETWLSMTLSALAPILRDLGDLAEARALIERAIEIEEGFFKEDHPTVASCYSTLALILAAAGDLPGARALMERAIGINEKYLDRDHPTLAVGYSHLAAILRALGDLAGASDQLERAIRVREKNPDRNAFQLATALFQLASILKDLGDLPGARDRMERAIGILERNYGKDHHLLAVGCSLLAAVLRDLGDLAGAKGNIERAIAIDAMSFDADHTRMAMNYHNLASIEAGLGRTAEAVALWRRAYAIRLRAFGPDYRDTNSTAAALTKHGHPPAP